MMSRAVLVYRAVRAARAILGVACVLGLVPLVARWRRASGTTYRESESESEADAEAPGRFVMMTPVEGEIQPCVASQEERGRPVSGWTAQPAQSRMPIFNIEVELDLDMAKLVPKSARPT
jgi:hypothetical protein